MRINKETLRQAFKAGTRFALGEVDFITHLNPASKKPDFDTWYASLSKKEEEVVEGDWVDLKIEKPTNLDFYLTKQRLSDEIISDWWTGTHFTFNDDYVTQWKRK